MTIALNKITYTTAATARGGRSGHVTSADGAVDLDLARPGSTDEPTANPETLFAAGYAACYQSALTLQGKKKGVDTRDSTVTAEVSLGSAEDGGYGLAVELKVALPGVAPELAREIVELAHQVCPYSKATRDNIQVTRTLV
jgi:osmotically inducible protein OsmC